MTEIFRQPVTPLHVSSLQRWSVGGMGRLFDGLSGVGALTWVANQACYMPLSIPWPYPVKRVFWMNGSTITTSNADFGIYTPSGRKIFSTGSTAMAGASAVQYVAVGTPFILAPGMYLMAWACDNTTARAFGLTIATPADGALAGCLTQASALALPATATPATFTSPGIPVCGITRTASGF